MVKCESRVHVVSELVSLWFFFYGEFTQNMPIKITLFRVCLLVCAISVKIVEILHAPSSFLISSFQKESCGSFFSLYLTIIQGFFLFEGYFGQHNNK